MKLKYLYDRGICGQSRILKGIIVFTIVIVTTLSGLAKAEKLTDGITWELSPGGVLSIKGKGAMPDFPMASAKHWLNKKYNGRVTEIHIGEGITSIGSYNFYPGVVGKSNMLITLRKVVLPSTLREIGGSAFSNTGVIDVEFPEGLETIYAGAFARCWRLKSITLPFSLKTLGAYAFADCKILESVNFSGAAATVGRDAFRDDKNLKEIKEALKIKFQDKEDGKIPTEEDVESAFRGTPVTLATLRPSGSREVIDTAVVKEEKSKRIPDGTWACILREGGEVYGEGMLKMTVSTPDKKAKYSDIPTPLGYYSFSGEGGSNELYVITDASVDGCRATLSLDDYQLDYDSSRDVEYWKKTGSVSKGTVTYNPATEAVTVCFDWGTELPVNMNAYPDRLPSDIFSNEYVGAIYGFEGDPVGSRYLSFKRVGNNVLMVGNEIYTNGRVYCNSYALGTVSPRGIILTKEVYSQGGSEGADDAFENNDFAKLESLMEPIEPTTLYFYDNTLYYHEEPYTKVN